MPFNLTIPSVYENGTIQTNIPQIGGLLYHESGYMAAYFQSTDPSKRPANLSIPAKDTDLDSDWALVGKHILQYAGPVSVTAWNKTHGNLTHGPLMFAAVPSMMGSEQKRNYRIEEKGNALVISAPSFGGGGTTTNLFFRRAPRRD
ncbi:hypothetical protein M011DRAFT_468359 [Sporormia fimetaria CBS 119925]|uniref:Lipocalin-like domain-containing protein n=1 Tax=Sporormia fimetaria CBS 119925 TaxID=1340428 RepID=A0A6A6V819_9PLEO|nr:hypothetical protein M011DRAFT_468359 [Sporormia fimetaria CBS 119925]